MVQLFETFDESVLDCWNNKCQADGSVCKALRPQQMASLARMLREFSIGLPFLGERETSLDIFGSSTQHGLHMMYMDDAQQADVSITQQWLRNRLWKLCCTHELLQVDHSCEELRYDVVVDIGCSTLAICEKMKLCTMEVHGLGIVSLCTVSPLFETELIYRFRLQRSTILHLKSYGLYLYLIVVRLSLLVWELDHVLQLPSRQVPALRALKHRCYPLLFGKATPVRVTPSSISWQIAFLRSLPSSGVGFIRTCLYI